MKKLTVRKLQNILNEHVIVVTPSRCTSDRTCVVANDGFDGAVRLTVLPKLLIVRNPIYRIDQTNYKTQAEATYAVKCLLETAGLNTQVHLDSYNGIAVFLYVAYPSNPAVTPKESDNGLLHDHAVAAIRRSHQIQFDEQARFEKDLEERIALVRERGVALKTHLQEAIKAVAIPIEAPEVL